MPPCHPLIESCEQILRERVPNFLRLYLNPYVTQTCLCLERYVQTTWVTQRDHYQTFLANGFDEALSGAIKLARFCTRWAGRPTTGVIFDPDGRLGPYAAAQLSGRGKVEFVPGLVVFGQAGAPDLEASGPCDYVVLVGAETLHRHTEVIHKVLRRDAPLVITCVDRAALTALRRGASGVLHEVIPDIVLFDESFVGHAVPFSAFTARRKLYDQWNRPGKTTFHSTTFQPNTIASLHFMRCLAAHDPEFHAALAPELSSIHSDLDVRRDLFRRLYSPSLYRAIRATRFDTAEVRASGAFVIVEGRPIFDGVSGVACSVRGHNPASYIAELESAGEQREVEAEVTSRLRGLTGLAHALPAVSGATAVENALKLALVAQHPRRHILALKAGFGGKTLLSLAGTANPAYKEHIDPLYQHVLYVDPFAPDALDQIDAAIARQPIAVVQMELIQAVGGVRRVPDRVIRHLDTRRREHGYLLLVDEVQTGMYRTGPFTVSGALSLVPDLLLLGKGTSDMMFPFALTLYSAAVQEQVDRAGSDLPSALRARYGYELGYRTVLNVLRRGDELSLSRRVTEAGALFGRLLGAGLALCKAVREVRVHGLLIGIELDADRWPQRWFRKRLYSFYLINLLRHQHYPALVGFCQYEPNVLKITPALTVPHDEIHKVCATITDVLNMPFPRLMPAVVSSLLQSLAPRRKKHEHRYAPALDAAAR
jgi:acetylornithine/succinyldiaminopimelate/putrescine aminotransferase